MWVWVQTLVGMCPSSGQGVGLKDGPMLQDGPIGAKPETSVGKFLLALGGWRHSLSSGVVEMRR